MNEIMKYEDSLLLPANQKAFEEKFSEVYKYYDPTTPMVVSVTYRDGQIRYSFHPRDLVEYVVKFAVAKQDGDYKIRAV